MFEIRVGELRATFLRNHNVRHYKGPQRHHTGPQAEDNPSPKDIPSGRHLKHRRPPQPRQPPQARGHCTRYGAVHPLRGAAPEQKRCIAYGSGAVPQHTRTNAELAHRTTHRRTPPCAAGPYWRQDGHAAHAATCTPAHSGPLRPNPTPPTPLHAKSRITYPRRRNLSASAQTARPSAHLPTPEARPATQHAPAPRQRHTQRRDTPLPPPRHTQRPAIPRGDGGPRQ